MKRALFAGAALLLTVSSAAFAATLPPANANGVTPGTPAVEPSTSPASTTTKTTTATPATPAPASAAVADTAAPSNHKATSDGSMFVSVPVRDDLSSSIVGLDIYNAANQDIGTIKDIAFGAGGVKAYIVGVGGFLGMGDHYIAVRPSAITLSYDDSAKKWHAAMETDADQLKAAPEFKYPGNS